MSSWQTYLTQKLNIHHPIILAPMFLVSQKEMIEAADGAGIVGCLPSLNYKSMEELKSVLEAFKQNKTKFGINLIVNQANVHLSKHIELLKNFPPNFIITSLGSPAEVIKIFKPLGTLIFCDVIDSDYSKKVIAMGADALIAVNSGAGGHLGKISASILVPMLKKQFPDMPIISAGGVGDGAGLVSMLALGAEGVSIGSPFIATKESPAHQGYKQACLDYGAEDIVVSTKISGTPCTVIKTPFVEKMGTEQNVVEKFLNSHKKIKKYAKMLTYYRGMKLLEKAAFQASYQTVWCAGQSIEFIDKEESIKTIVDRIVNESEIALKQLQSRFKN
ncbi:MAG: nitronate monooxygenase [Bacteriovoracaceae bacterium]|nr:nitronate monooxygenase [Bacteriovoracaceae bacterium]